MIEEVERLRDAIRHIDRLLQCEAAEYVPAIGHVFAYIDSLNIPCEYCNGTGSIKVDFEHPQWITCEACKSKFTRVASPNTD